MHIHDIAFVLAAAFIGGIALNHFSNAIIGLFFLGIIFLGIVYKEKLTIVTLVFFGCAVGVIYVSWWGKMHQEKTLVFDERVTIQGVVRAVVKKDENSEIVVGNIKIETMREPEYRYGDAVRIEGKIKKPSPIYREYLLKDGVIGVMHYPKIVIEERGRGNKIKTILYEIKKNVELTIKNLLPYENAALLEGLLLGEKDDFSKEQYQKFIQSGTAHIVALSGYNIIVIGDFIATLLRWIKIKSEKYRFYGTIVLVVMFVALTGAEASVVRAAIMGFVLMLANYMERMYSTRNALTITGAAMLVQNPKLLLFDIGFQLSFCSLLGIIYLRPFIQRILRLGVEPGTLDWRKNLATTLAAQFAVFPLLIATAHAVSWHGILSNLLILWAIPITMLVGFIMVLAGSIALPFGAIIAPIVNILLVYEQGVITIFSKF